MEYPLLSLELAREIELAEAEAAVGCAERLSTAHGDGAGAVAAVAGGFAVYCGANSPVTQELLGIMRMFAEGKNTECYFARLDGKIAGGATVALRGRIAGLFGASTLPQFRNRGVQTALLHARMQRAAERGCELAMSIALPGSASQRNITRQGFQTLYTRVKFERAFGEG